VSVSHAGDWVVLAGTPAGATGVDIEQIVELDHQALLRYMLATTGSSQDETIVSQHDFFRLWTLKESVVKATGDGLRTPMTAVLVGPGPTLLRYRDQIRPPAVMTDLSAPDGYVGAATVWTARHVLFIEHDATVLLSSLD
jgi:4'-phosphopantetheinyl transferase